MWATIEKILLCVLGGGALATIFEAVKFFISRKDTKKQEENEQLNLLRKIREQGDKNSLDLLRVQIAVLVADYPGKVNEILHLAYVYVVENKGNSWIRSILADWFETQNIEKPDWWKE